MDWNQASIGPPAVDVGHMRWNLATTFGQGAADRFREGLIGHRLWDQPRWDLVTVLDLVLDVPNPPPAPNLARLEDHLAASLAEAS